MTMSFKKLNNPHNNHTLINLHPKKDYLKKEGTVDVWSLQSGFRKVIFQLNVTKTCDMSFDLRARGLCQKLSITIGVVIETDHKLSNTGLICRKELK